MDDHIDPNAISQLVGNAALSYAEAKHQYDLAKHEAESAFDINVAALLDIKGMTVEKAKAVAKADPRYIEMREMVFEKARLANLAKAEETKASVWWEATRSLESTRREEMKIR